MDTVTYPDVRVVEELTHWRVVRLDVSTDSAAAEALGVTAVPTAVAVNGEGRELGRLSNRIEAGEFSDRLRRMRESAR